MVILSIEVLAYQGDCSCLSPL